MPELPEVENVKRTLQKLVPEGTKILRLQLRRKDLRFPFPPKLKERLETEKLLRIDRRAKYLIFETENYWLLSHLGMTGSWRKLDELKVHDHVLWDFDNGLTLAFNDPRRFGFLELHKKSDDKLLLEGLGPEPLSPQFSGLTLFNSTRGSKQPIKNFLLNQKNVAGIGNIYACEGLFLAKVRPQTKAGRITQKQAESLALGLKDILLKAIRSGGSTIRDYVNANGERGQFQTLFSVYGRAQKPCTVCGQPIRLLRQAGRASFWCSQCQK